MVPICFWAFCAPGIGTANFRAGAPSACSAAKRSRGVSGAVARAEPASLVGGAVTIGPEEVRAATELLALAAGDDGDDGDDGDVESAAGADDRTPDPISEPCATLGVAGEGGI
jgi:hypothetical protein